MPALRLPFQDMTREAWQKLAMAALLLVYAAQIVLEIVWGNLFGNLGVDFAAFWSAGNIANHYGYAAVYDLEFLRQVQQQIAPARAAAISGLRVLPTAYLPIFLLPFQLLALLPPSLAAGVWFMLNLVGSAAYLGVFATRVAGPRVGSRQLLLFMISVPVFLNLFVGQANLWLMICVGEFLLARGAGKHFVSGAWLAGLLLKPQCLLLIAPALLPQRWMKTALGMIATGAAIVGASWLLAGPSALVRLIQMWFGYVGGLPSSDIQLMVNWRMVGLHMAGLVGPGFASGIVAAGMTSTAAVAWSAWVRPLRADRTGTATALLGLLAATTLVAWHSHAHMAMILLPLLLMLALEQPAKVGRILNIWIFVPAALYVLRIPMASLMRLGILDDHGYGFVDSMVAIGLFAVNVVLVVWALSRLRPWKTAGT